VEKAHLALQQRQVSGYDSPLYQVEMSETTPDKLAMMAELQQAIAAQQLQLDVQPQVLLPDRQVVAAEVLLRWAHPVHGLLAPKQFIPLAESMGLMFPLTCWVLRQTVQMLATLQQEGILVQLAVNISSSDLLQIELVEQIQQLLQQYQVKPGQLILELKEEALMADPQTVLPMLKRLRSLGLTLVLDDFGTGYTSLGMLREFPLQQVKIDAQFISGMHKSDAQVAITGAIIDLAKNLKLDVVAEGVEEQACAEKLTRMGCLRAQGFLFSQPFALAGLPAWMRQHQFNSGVTSRPGLL
jgi:EAL domain-containing protein (putative c-di-GMP-specific phosphodiesterase class I)